MKNLTLKLAVLTALFSSKLFAAGDSLDGRNLGGSGEPGLGLWIFLGLVFFIIVYGLWKGKKHN